LTRYANVCHMIVLILSGLRLRYWIWASVRIAIIDSSLGTGFLLMLGRRNIYWNISSMLAVGRRTILRWIPRMTDFSIFQFFKKRPSIKFARK
jgi:hypothetical protein